jgi:glycosyltransferase involved in cell wall biosynthesis
MKIGIVATHSFPIPSPTHTGDVVILDLAKSLDEMGHTVNLYAPEGTHCTSKGKVFPMRASYGKYPPAGEDCEQECFNNHAESLRNEDIVHDFSVTKRIVQSLYNECRKNIISTIMGGAWMQSQQPHNLIVWSESHRDRVIRGATDYENTPTPNLAGINGNPVKEAHIVNGGIDTEYYCPTYEKKNFLLWMNRWHPVKGYSRAIEIARLCPDIEIVLAGEHPDREMFDYQKQCALEAVKLAEGLPNVKFEWLPADPHHHEAKRALYQQAKALLYTIQFNEPFGLSQVEALACGTPVIGTNYGSVPEVISDGVTGFVCENDVQKFIEAIRKIDNINPQTCREHAVRRFDRRVMANSYLTQYNEVISGKGWS